AAAARRAVSRDGAALAVDLVHRLAHWPSAHAYPPSTGMASARGRYTVQRTQRTIGSAAAGALLPAPRPRALRILIMRSASSTMKMTISQAMIFAIQSFLKRPFRD